MVAVVCLAVAHSASAQTASSSSSTEEIRARSNLSIMEGVLEGAVILGANTLVQRVRAVVPEDVLLLSGEAHARGFRLEGYGLFFDVAVPVLRQSVAWSLRALMDQSGVPLSAALAELRTYVHSVSDPRERRSLKLALQRIELQVGAGTGGMVPTAVGAAVSPPAALEIPPAALAWLSDPDGAYTAEVKSALVDAMLEHSGGLAIEPDEWLTVAARDNARRHRLNPGDEGRSITLRVQGRDLAELHAGRLSIDEARRRVVVQQD